MIAPGVATVLLSTLVGMVGLLGVRDILGPWGYRLAAFPVGLLVWPIIIFATTITGSIMLWRVVLPVAAVYALSLLALGRLLRKSPAPRPSAHGLAGDAIFLGVVAMVAGAAAASGLSVATADSWSNYAVMGYRLRDTGDLTPFMFAHRGVFLPSVHAADVFMGGSWTHVVYPVMGAEVAALVAFATWNTAFDGLDRRMRAIATAGIVALMVTTAVFVLHSIYMHSHMITAMCMLLAVVALQRAAVVQAETGADCGGRDAAAWAVVAGLATMGMVYARPDGLAYALAVVSLAAVLLWSGRLSRWATATYLVAVVGGSAALVALLVWRGGLYEVTRRLSATENIAMVAGLAVLAVLVLAAERIGPLAEWLRRPGMAVGMVVAADILLLTLVAATSDGGLVTALGIAWENLFASSYFNLTWWWAAGVVIVGLLLSATGSRREWLPLVLLVVVQFFVVAFTVHGMLHHGRSGWSDSFTRVSFHIVPVLFWLFALEFGEVADRLGGARAVSRVSEGESPSESEGSRPAAASE